MRKTSWQVVFIEKAEKEFSKLDKDAQRAILKYLQTKIETVENPRRFGKNLAGKLKNLWRYRVGDYRILCSIEDDEIVVLVVSVGHRKEIYE
ncbi:MAG: type II toxin-antitoxin system RelE/ParE family toxin [Caedimonadaceae bacterium]|nr:MAG: type II toxin-antitoxin system RelE/ParE family toxin [Caedimonadaceae bacterium]